MHACNGEAREGCFRRYILLPGVSFYADLHCQEKEKGGQTRRRCLSAKSIDPRVEAQDVSKLNGEFHGAISHIASDVEWWTIIRVWVESTCIGGKGPEGLNYKIARIELRTTTQSTSSVFLPLPPHLLVDQALFPRPPQNIKRLCNFRP